MPAGGTCNGSDHLTAVMSTPNKRLNRVNELLRREIGSYILTRMTDHLQDASAITVTHVLTSSNLRSARVLVSILGHEEERSHLLRELEQHRIELQDHIKRTVRLKYTPKLKFKLDTSLEEGDRVLELLEHLDEPHTPDASHDETHP